MSRSSVSVGFAKCFIFFMAIVILLQGAAYLGLAIWGITMDECHEQATDITAKPFTFALDLIYFAKKECGDPTITVPILGNTQEVVITMDWNTSYTITNRMNIFMITYAAISALWVITSLVVIATLCGAMTKLISAICFWPWFLVVIAGSILDAVATGYHVHDIYQTTSVDGTFSYIGATASPEVLGYLKSFDAYFITPAVVMTCISSRVILIWLLNLFGTTFCLTLSRVLSRRESTPQYRARDTNDAHEFVAPTAQRDMQELRHSQTAMQHQSSVASVSNQYPEYDNQIKPKPLPIQITPAVVSSGPSSPVTPKQQQQQQPRELHEHTTTYRSTDTHPDRLDYPAHQQQSQPQSPLAQQQSPPPPSVSAQQQLYAGSSLNTRYASADPALFAELSGGPGQMQQQQRVSAELRSQLPWSYTSMMSGKPQPPPPPRKPQVQVYPQIPEPDYMDT